MGLYDAITQEGILNDMLESVSPKFDKREGAIIYDATAPASVVAKNLYIAADAVMDEAFIDTATREYLIRHGKDRNITPKPASCAKVKGAFTPVNLEIPIGSRYSHEDLNYRITEKIADGLYYLECETLGSAPNGVTGRLIPIDYISGLQTAEILEVTIPGEDEEDTESLRARIIGAYQSQAFGGNQLDYINKILSISGVGGLRIYSGAQWNGGGTVLLVIKDSDNSVPTDEFINTIQTDIDPVTNSGEGIGIAPIGHFVTVVPANETVVNIETDLSFSSGVTWESVRDKVKDAVDAHLMSLNAKWNYDTPPITVRIAYIESALLNVPGVIDVQNTTINGSTLNLAVDKDSLVSGGTINGY